MNAYSRGAKKRAKRGKRALEALQERVQDAITIVEQDKPQETVINARARIMNRPPSKMLLHPMLCEEAGRAIDLGAKDPEEAMKLWGVFKRYDQAEHIYYTRIIGNSRFPNVSKMEYLPEVFETSADDVIDTRTFEQKVNDTQNAWQKWNGYLGHMKGHERQSIIRASWRMDELHKGGDLTVTGIAFVAALRVLMEVVDK